MGITTRFSLALSLVLTAAVAAPVNLFELKPPTLAPVMQANMTSVSWSPFWTVSQSYIWVDLEAGVNRVDNPLPYGGAGRSYVHDGKIYYAVNGDCYTSRHAVDLGLSKRNILEDAEYVGTKFLRDTMVDVWQLRLHEVGADYVFDYHVKAGTNILWRLAFRSGSSGKQGYADFFHHSFKPIDASVFSLPSSCSKPHSQSSQEESPMIVPSIGLLAAATYLV